MLRRPPPATEYRAGVNPGLGESGKRPTVSVFPTLDTSVFNSGFGTAFAGHLIQ